MSRVLCITQDAKIRKQLDFIVKAAGAEIDFTERIPQVIEDAGLKLVIYDLAEGEENITQARQFLEKNEKQHVPVFFLTHTLNQEEKISLLDFDGCNNLRVRDGVIEQSEFAADIKKILSGNIFGLNKYLPFGSEIKTIYVTNYVEKSNCISTVSQYAARMKVRKPIRNAIEQVLDELLMNAIYDAPVDKDGQPLFANLPTELRVNVQLDTKKRVRVEFGCTNRYFAISVQDHYGSLQKRTILQYWKKCIHEKNQIDQKPGGAGLGLYLVLNSVTGISINLQPRVSTEMVCLFDLNYKNRDLPKSFQIHYEQDSGPGAPGQQPVVTRQRKSAGILYLLTTLLVLIVAVAVLFVTQFQKNKGAKNPPEKTSRLALSSLNLTSTPPGARIMVNGKPLTKQVNGKTVPLLTPASVTNLRAGHELNITLEKEGYHRGLGRIKLRPGTPGSLSVPLKRKMVSLKINSSPGGASVSVNGKNVGTTPYTLKRPFGHVLTVTLAKPGFRDLTRKLDTSKGNYTLDMALKVHPDYGYLTIESVPAGAKVRIAGKQLTSATPIRRYLLMGGKSYSVNLEKKGFRPWNQKFTMEKGANPTLKVKLVAVGGLSIQANVEVQVFLNRKFIGKTPLIQPSIAAGKYRLRLVNKKLKIDYRDRLPFTVTSGGEVNKKYTFHKVLVKAPPTAVISPRRSKAIFRNGDTMLLTPGRHVLTVKKTQEEPEKIVVVRVVEGRKNRLIIR